VDPFAGTGTTAIAALETGRCSINIEIEPSYIDLIVSRLQRSKVTGQIEIHRSFRLLADDTPLFQQVAHDGN
jgi:DNA modification methylase